MVALETVLADPSPSNNRWRGPRCVNGLAPRAPGDSVRPQHLSGVVGRPLNFTVRRLFSVSRTLLALSYRRGE